MWPSDFVEGIRDGPLHQRSKKVCQIIYGDDCGQSESDSTISFDFDMAIDKAPHTDTDVPWHQDEGYWVRQGLDFEDARAASCWVRTESDSVLILVHMRHYL